MASDEIELERIKSLIASNELSYSLFCLKLAPDYLPKMSVEEFFQLMKLIMIYRMDTSLLMGLSNSPKYNEQTKNEV